MERLLRMTPDELCKSLSRFRFRGNSEAQFAAGVELAIGSLAIEYAREVTLGPGVRLDFLCGDIGVELKVDGSLADLTRQAHRYLQEDRVAGLLIVTTCSKHRDLPDTISGKPVRVLWARGL